MRHPLLMPSTKLGILFVLLIVFVWLLVGVDGASQLKISLVPSVCNEPCKFSTRIEIGPEIKEGDWTCIYVADELARRPACFKHPGFKRTTVIISNIPAGTYEVRVEVGSFRDSAMLLVK